MAADNLYLGQLDVFFEKAQKETDKLIKKKWNIKEQENTCQQEKARYAYILSKHKVMLLRQLKVDIDLARETLQTDAKLRALYPNTEKSQIEHIKCLNALNAGVIGINKALNDELRVRVSYLQQGLKGHPNEKKLLLKLQSKMSEAEKNLDKTPEIFMEIEGELGFRLEYDSRSLFVKTGYNHLANLYKKISETKIEKDEDLNSGAKLVASWMVNRALPDETQSELNTNDDYLTLEDNNGQPNDLISIIEVESESLNPITEYQKKLEDAKFKQYQRLQRTFVDMTDMTKRLASYKRDLGNRLVNRVIPDTQVINHFINTDLRSYGANGLDTDLHKVFVLMMKGDTSKGVTLDLLKTLQEKYFSRAASLDKKTGKYADSDQNEMSAAELQKNMQDFLSELVSSLALILQQQMESGGGDKKPQLVKPLNNLLRKYDHPYRIGKTQITEVLEDKLITETKDSTYKLAKDKKTYHRANLYEKEVRGKDGKEIVEILVDKDNPTLFYHKSADGKTFYQVDKYGYPVYRLTLVEQKPLTAREHTVKKVIKPRVGLFAVLFNIVIGLGAGGLTAAAVLALPFAWATLPIALFIGFCGVYVNYKLYHFFFKPFITRIAVHGLFDALFGKGASLNIFLRTWNQSNVPGKIVVLIAGVLLIGLLIAPMVFGFSALVAFATMNSMMVTAMAVVAGSAVLVAGAAVLAVAGFITTFIVHLPVILEVTMGIFNTTKDLIVAAGNFARGETDEHGFVKDSFIKIFLRGVVVGVFLTILIVPVVGLIKANILTGEEFQSGTAAFGNTMRRVFSAFPSTTRISVFLQRLGLPGITLLSITGLFNSAKDLGIKMVFPAILGAPTWIKGKVIGLSSTVRGIPAWVKRKFAPDTSEQVKINKEKAEKYNPWQSSVEDAVEMVGVVTDGGALLVNAFGNGVISADETKSKRAGIAVTVLGGMSSFFSCILGFMGLKKTSMGEQGVMVDVNGTYTVLKAKLNKAGDANNGGEAGKKEAIIEDAHAKNGIRHDSVQSFNSIAPGNEERAEIEVAEAIVPEKSLKQVKSVTEKCHGFFEKIQNKDHKVMQKITSQIQGDLALNVKSTPEVS